MFSTKGIVLNIVKYGDTSLIANIYTEMFGLQGYILKGIRKHSSKSEMGIYQPLSLLDMEVSHNNKNALQYVKEAKPFYTYTSAQTNMNKCSVMIFLSEILYKCLKTQESDQSLFDFIANALEEFDKCETKFADFHLLFMINLSKYLGFFPKNREDQNHEYFDMIEAEFVRHLPSHENIIKPPVSNDFNNLLNMPFSKEHFQLESLTIRFDLLSALIKYYNEHIPNFEPVKSHYILHEVLQ